MFDKKTKKYHKTKLESYFTGLIFGVIFFSGFLVWQDAEAATYYLRADGTATSKGSANSCSVASTAMSVATHNAQTFSADDVIALCDDGGDYKSGLIAPSSGSDGHPIIYKNADGDTPVIDLSQDVGGSGWTNIGNGVYTKSGYAYYMTEDNIPIPACSWGDDSTCVNGTGNWFYDTGSYVLYYRPTSGTPADHAIRTMWNSDYGLNLSNRSYVTVYGLTFNRCWYGIYHGQSSTAPVSPIQNIIIRDNNFIRNYWAIFANIYTGVESDVSIYNNTISYCNSGISAWTNSDTTVGHSQHHTRYSIHNNTITHQYSYTADDSAIWQTGFRIRYWFTDHEGISFQDIQDSVISDNIISNNFNQAMTSDEYWNRAIYFYLTNSDAKTSGNSILRNKISGLYVPALYISGEPSSNGGFENNTYAYNVISYDKNYSGHGSFLANFYSGSNLANKPNYFYNNTIYNANSGLAFSVGAGGSCGKWFVKNNIFNSPSGIGIYYGPYLNNDMTFEHNLYNPGTWSIQDVNGGGINPVAWSSWKNTYGFDAVGSDIANPVFVSSSDLALQSTSPAINAGIDVGLTSDFAGNPIVGLPDIGAYEYSSSESDTTAPASPTGLSVQ